jgi:hypothetical protein
MVISTKMFWVPNMHLEGNLGKNAEKSFVTIRQGVSKEELKREFRNDVRPDLAAIPPDLWSLH